MKKLVKIIMLTAAFGLGGAAHADDDRYQTANVLDATGAFPFPYYTGAAWLVRERNKVEGRIMSKVSTAGDPYTLWIVVFNNPSACAGSPCMGSDLQNPAVRGSVFNGTGAISASDGNGGGVVNMDFSIEAGDLPNGLFLLGGDPKGIRQANGFGAEIHLVVDKHPPVGPGMSWIPDLTTTNFPGFGPATNETFAIFLACSSRPSACPASPF